jgi:ankyrin repeat protein
VGLVFCVTVSVALANEPEGKPQIDFQKDVAPILVQHCIDCHGPHIQLSDLRLDQRQFAIVEGRDRDLIKPGDAANSLLIQRLTDKKFGLIMPPTFPLFPEDKVGLPETQIQTLKKWIDEGAAWPEGINLSHAQSDSAGALGTALFAAIRSGDRSATGKLLQQIPDVNIVDRYGATPLMHAATYSDEAILRQLLELGANVNAADHGGATALMLSAGDLGKVRVLLEHGANVQARSEMGRTPLLIACTYAGNVEVVQLLLKAGAKITDRDLFGETVLIAASKVGDGPLVETLLAAGAEIGSEGGFAGRSPLAWAAEFGHVDTMACLLKHGAGKDPKSLNTALFNAAIRGPASAVRLLLDHGANARNPAGFGAYTPLMGAVYSENADAEIVQMLLKHGADVKDKAATGDTALSLARKRGKTEIVRILVSAGASE